METDIKTILVEAKEVVADADLPNHLQPLAFEYVLDVLSAERSKGISTASGPQNSEGLAASKRDNVTPARSLLSKLANELSLPADKIERVYLIEENNIDVVVSPKLLSNSKSGATKELTLLVAAGRQCSGMEDETSIESIREVCDDFGFYDSSNFSGSVSELKGALRIQGKGQERQIKITRNGIEIVKNMIQRFLGDEA